MAKKVTKRLMESAFKWVKESGAAVGAKWGTAHLVRLSPCKHPASYQINLGEDKKGKPNLKWCSFCGALYLVKKRRRLIPFQEKEQYVRTSSPMEKKENKRTRKRRV